MAKLVRKQYDDQGVASEQSADAVLDAVAPIVDAKTGSVQIDLTASQVPNNWVSGMFVQIEITTEEALNAVTVPNSAIVYENGKSFVFRVGPPVLRGPANDQVELKVEKIPVVLGIKDTIMIEVKSGLAQFDQIISEGQGHLIDGSIVEIIQ
jgi:multidrug efflux pump subunit AcrA (membrane-fusion protein)